MGKAGFWLRGAKGKLAGTTLYKGKVGTIQREVVEVSNPKTTGQMRQRALFAECVKFYKHAQKNLFKFAFEDKKQQESDYNAFVRHNVQNSIVLPYDNVKNDRFPALGNAWVLTYGSLASPVVHNMEGNNNPVLEVEGVTVESSAGEVFSAIMRAYDLQKGDFITIIGIQSYVDSLNGQPNVGPKWTIKQYVIDPDATEMPDIFIVGSDVIELAFEQDDDFACGSAVVFSRDIPGSGVKVSTSRLINNDAAYELVNAAMDENAIAAALNSWGATGKPILQGSLVERTTTLVPEFVGFRGAGVNVVDAATYNLSDAGTTLVSGYNAGEVNYVCIVGSNLEALDVSKFMSTNPDVAIALRRDTVYGYYLALDIEGSVTGTIEILYDGSGIFDMEV